MRDDVLTTANYRAMLWLLQPVLNTPEKERARRVLLAHDDKMREMLDWPRCECGALLDPNIPRHEIVCWCASE